MRLVAQNSFYMVCHGPIFIQTAIEKQWMYKSGVPTTRFLPPSQPLCKLHRTAFNSYIVGVRPDYIIEVRPDVLNEEDGPMLRHGLVALNKKQIILPSPSKLSPDPRLLEKRYEEFRAAS